MHRGRYESGGGDGDLVVCKGFLKGRGKGDADEKSHIAKYQIELQSL